MLLIKQFIIPVLFLNIFSALFADNISIAYSKVNVEYEKGLIENLQFAKPDILILSNIKQKYFETLQQEFPQFTYSKIFKTTAILSKYKPLNIDFIDDKKYKVKKIEQNVRNGFLNIEFKFANYAFRVISFDIPDSDKKYPISISDIKRYEVRQLRYLVTDYLNQNIDSNILVVGSIDASYSHSTVKEIYYRRYKHTKELFDLRPYDKMSNAWTKYAGNDIFLRHDYIFATYAMLSEVIDSQIIDESKISQNKNSHRLLLTNISNNNKKLYSKEELYKQYPKSIKKN